METQSSPSPSHVIRGKAQFSKVQFMARDFQLDLMALKPFLRPDQKHFVDQMMSQPGTLATMVQTQLQGGK